MGLFSDIFDGLSNDVSDLFTSGSNFVSSALSNTNVDKGLVGVAGQLLTGNSAASQQYNNKLFGQIRTEQIIAGRLDQGVLPGYNSTDTNVPTHSRNSFDATKSVDPMTLENEWHNRLSTYADITRETGVSETGR